MKEGEGTWILKPSLTNQALAVTVFDRVADLYTALEAAPKLHEWVLQRCVPGGRCDVAPVLLSVHTRLRCGGCGSSVICSIFCRMPSRGQIHTRCPLPYLFVHVLHSLVLISTEPVSSIST